ncbi:MAG: ABC transporter ATP-binding protein [Planctomycetes bacterium]|nr:ABC transporter ATP-binding protein [Planctomycetota bacterium]
MIVTRGLHKRFDQFVAVHALDLDIQRGEWFIFLGHNGAGKTTTIRMLLGLATPSAGSAHVLGHNVLRDGVEVRRRSGYLPERFQPYPYLSGREYLDFCGDMFGIARRDRRRRIDELLDLMEMSAFADELIRNYSFGMKKKTGFCAALLHRPEILFLDEPTADLDPKTSNLIRQVIRGLCDQGRTVFMTTHILGITEKVCDSIGIFDHGRLLKKQAWADFEREFPGLSMEEIFLHLTGDVKASKVVEFLDAERPGASR